MSPAPGAAGPRALRVRVGGIEAAVPLSALVEVCRMLPVDPASDVPAGVRGMVRWRGAPVPLLDLATLLGAPEAPLERLLVVRVEERHVAVGVEAVHGFVALDDLVPLPPLLAGGDASVVAAVARLDGALVRVLDAARLLPIAHADGLS